MTTKPTASYAKLLAFLACAVVVELSHYHSKFQLGSIAERSLEGSQASDPLNDAYDEQNVTEPDKAASAAAATEDAHNDRSWHPVHGERFPVARDAAKLIDLSEATDNATFCVSWDLNATDSWWTHHVEWEVFHEDDTHYCFRKIQNRKKAGLFRKLYRTQFHGDCSQMISKTMISSGWGADMMVVSDGLMHAERSGFPVQVQKAKWHYATPKPFEKADQPSACSTDDMFCYFLPVSSCPAVETAHETLFFRARNSLTDVLCCQDPSRWYLEFATRPQSWLRKRVYDFAKAQTTNLQTPCTVLHVRRADVVLHDQQSRRYHAISEYLDASDAIRDNILLLTDDQNAIGEAEHEFPDKHWMYLNRTRHRGSSGGWESQIPSNDPVYEVTVILGTFRLVQQCSSIVRSKGGFGDLLFGSMLQANPSARSVKLEDVQRGADVYNEKNSETVTISKAYDANGKLEESGDSKPIIQSNVKKVKTPIKRAKVIKESSWHRVEKVILPVAENAKDLQNMSKSSFCVSWDLKATDSWWTHHVEWEVFHEDDTHYCFRKIQNRKKAGLFRKLYRTQFHGDCSQMISKTMISSGWGADMMVVSDGLMHAERSGFPVQVQKAKWHYATPKPFEKADQPSACSTDDMFCYFLPVSSCPAVETAHETLYFNSVKSPIFCCQDPSRWYLEFATRPQSWLRKRVYDFVKAQSRRIRAPCTVLHVRRADVVVHAKLSRRYHAISEYMNASVAIDDNILLLTDDHNAIGEAEHEFPDRRWMYLNRTRHRGKSGGWESQIPSNDPVYEVTVILGTFQLVQKCSSIIRSKSGFGDLLFGSMLQANSSATSVMLEDVQKIMDVHSKKNRATVNISRSYS